MRPPKKASPRTVRFGRHLARLRTQAGLTQEILAEKAGISARYVQDLEAGLYSPTIWIVEALRKALKVSWLDILRGIGKADALEETPPKAKPGLLPPPLTPQPMFMPKGKPDDESGPKRKR